MADKQHVLTSGNAITTYRYLRIGMVAAVVLLTASLAIEYSTTQCWLTSISAYYYTPVRSIFVGGLIAIGFALIVITGRRFLEDLFLNFAGMLAPIVALVPTSGVGDHCHSSVPTGAVTADALRATIESNVEALLIAGAFGWAAALLVALLAHFGVINGTRMDRWTTVSVAVTAAVLVVTWWGLVKQWEWFSDHAHFAAAGLMFAFLFGAVTCKAIENRNEAPKRFFPVYVVVAAAMLVGGAFIWLVNPFGDHRVFALEVWEIAFFAAFWAAQTIENWNEKAVSGPTVHAPYQAADVAEEPAAL